MDRRIRKEEEKKGVEVATQTAESERGAAEARRAALIAESEGLLQMTEHMETIRSITII